VRAGRAAGLCHLSGLSERSQGNRATEMRGREGSNPGPRLWYQVRTPHLTNPTIKPKCYSGRGGGLSNMFTGAGAEQGDLTFDSDTSTYLLPRPPLQKPRYSHTNDSCTRHTFSNDTKLTKLMHNPELQVSSSTRHTLFSPRFDHCTQHQFKFQ